jgi:hypothetical protein
MAKAKIPYLLILASLFLLMISPCPAVSFAFSTEEIKKFQADLEGKTKAEKIAFWAERFIGTPYDKDPEVLM